MLRASDSIGPSGTVKIVEKDMADLASAPTAARCQVNATLSASIDDGKNSYTDFQMKFQRFYNDFS